MMRLKNRVWEIVNGLIPLEEDIKMLDSRTEGLARSNCNTLSACGATDRRTESMQRLVQGSPWHLTPLNPLNYYKTSNNRMTTRIQTMTTAMTNMQIDQNNEMREMKKQNHYLLQNINELREHMVNLSRGVHNITTK